MCQRKMVAIEICYGYVHVLKGGNEDVAKTDDLFCFSRGLASVSGRGGVYVFMSEMFQQFQLSVCSFRQDRRAEGLHDLLHRHGLAGKLVFCGTARRWSVTAE